MNIKDLMLFLDNENYRVKGDINMNDLDTKQYFNFLDNESLLWSFSQKPVALLSDNESKLYFSFLDNDSEMEKYVPKIQTQKNITQPKTISTQIEPVKKKNIVQKTKQDSVLDVYLKVAKEDYAELFNKDSGLLFEIYLRKLIPLKQDVVLGWASDEMSKSGVFTDEFAKITQRYIDLKPKDVLTKLVNDIREKPSFWKKLTGVETKLTEAGIYLGSIRDELKPIQDYAVRLKEDSTKNFEKLTLLSYCLAIVSKCAEEENQTDGIYRYLYNRRDTLLTSVLQAGIISKRLPALIDEIIDVSQEIESVINNTIPTIRAARASNV